MIVPTFGMPLTDVLGKFNKFQLLQVGESGHGKTTRMFSASRFGRLYVFDFDGKIQGAARNLSVADKSLIFTDNFKEHPVSVAFKRLDEIKNSFDKGEKPYATIAVDTFTNLNEKLYIKAMGKKLEAGTKAEYDEWGKIDNDMIRFFDKLFSLPCNLIINCHLGEGEDRTTKRAKYIPAGRGGYRHNLAGKMTDTHYLFIENGAYCVRVRNSETYPVNTIMPDRFITPKGLTTVNDLSVFDEYAFKIV